jgi:Uma2 family endonuclease
MDKTAIKIGPLDQGRRMSLAEFDLAEGQPGHLYELSRGVVTVVDVPNWRHLAQVDDARLQFDGYRINHPKRIYTIASGGECKILIAGLDSERHPDLAIYKFPPTDEEDIWATWVPEIVIEVVSLGSELCDYNEKREEYFRFGVSEYWIIDAERREMLVLRRSRGRWAERTVQPPELYKTRLLPGFEFSCALVFQAANNAGK